MPVKKEKRLGRPTRAAQPNRRSAVKGTKSSRSLSESRLQSSKKTEKSSRRLSVASQSVSRPVRKLEKKEAGKRRPVGSNLSASVYDLKGKAVGRVSLPAEIFGVAENPKLLAQAVRVYLANQRGGFASTKTRGEVKGSTRKIYRQKGTGRARHGGIRAPIFVGGGIALGPKPRDFSLSLPQKMKRLALFSSLSSKFKDREIKIIDLTKITPKTKIMANALRRLELSGKTLLVTPGGIGDFKNVYLSARNIEGVKILTATTLNAYDVLDNKGILFMRDSLDILKKHFLKSHE